MPLYVVLNAQLFLYPKALGYEPGAFLRPAKSVLYPASPVGQSRGTVCTYNPPNCGRACPALKPLVALPGAPIAGQKRKRSFPQKGTALCKFC